MSRIPDFSHPTSKAPAQGDAEFYVSPDDRKLKTETGKSFEEKFYRVNGTNQRSSLL